MSMDASFPSAPPGAGAPPLITHSATGTVDALQALLREGVPDIDAPYGFGPALSWASHKGHTQVCELLLEHNANPNKLNSAGMGPLSYAVLGLQADSNRRWVPLRTKPSKRTFRVL